MAIDICVRLGRRIRFLREKHGWTQQQLADMTGIGRVHVSELENGKREAGLKMLEKLSSSFGISVSDLLKDLGDHPKAAIDDQVKSGHREKA
jgi:transcriptional regulator with XRE-family HTH domain